MPESFVKSVHADVALQQPLVAMGMSMYKIQRLIQTVADEHAPHFPQGQEPLAEGRTFRAADGALYYRPRVRVGEREAPTTGPDVRFLKDADGKVRLVFELEEDPDTTMPAEAKPVNVRVTDLVLRWKGGERRFSEPTLIEAADSQNDMKPAFAIRVGAELTAPDVEALNAALSNPQSGARVDVTFMYGFWVDTAAEPPKVGVKPPLHSTVLIPRNNFAVISIVARPELTMTPPVAAPTAVINRPSSMAHFTAASSLKLDRPALVAAAAKAAAATNQSNFRSETFTRSVPFTFDPGLNQNRQVYAAIRGADSLNEAWIDTEFGPVRKAPYPNTVYYLPQEIRLAFNPEMGTAHVVPNLYRDERDEIRVRVTLRAVPWFDPEKLVALRDHLYRSTGGALASPRLVAGGYQKALFKLLTAFPEQIHTLDQADISIDLSGGVDLTLDLSLEFYRFVAELLTGPVGLVGEARVLLQETPGAGNSAPPVRLERAIPVRLRYDLFGNFQLGVAVEKEAIRPDEVTIRNEAGGDVKVGGCLTRLLQLDSNSVVPLEVYDAESEAPFPKTLGPNETMVVKLKPQHDSPAILWNAVEVNLTNLSLAQTPAHVLERVHEVAPSGTLSWKINIECPPFQRSPIPEQFNNLFRVEAQLSRPGFAIQQVVLGRETPTANITMQRTLKDLMNEQGGGRLSFKYRVRNVYFDHAGKWGNEQDVEGSNLFVFPNPTAND